MTVDFAPFISSGQNILRIETDKPGALQIGPVLFDHDHWMLTDYITFCMIVACLKPNAFRVFSYR